MREPPATDTADSWTRSRTATRGSARTGTGTGTSNNPWDEEQHQEQNRDRDEDQHQDRDQHHQDPVQDHELRQPSPPVPLRADDAGRRSRSGTPVRVGGGGAVAGVEVCRARGLVLATQ